jgi:hypothetical protein
MLSREEYERVITTFLVELSRLCLDASEEDLRALPRLAGEIDDYLESFRDPENHAGQVLRTAFAYVDEYIGAEWDRVASAGYSAYKIAHSKAGAGTADA